MIGPPLTTTESTSQIVIDKVSRSFRTTSGQRSLALGEVSLNVQAGEFVCLLGPSGCGKTTLLNMIAGFLAPTSGRIVVDGALVTGPGLDRGVVFQDYSLFGWLTVRQNVEFGPRMTGARMAERRALADHYLKLVGLQDVGDKYPFELSGGMKQRVAIARALVTRPGVLLMDEPFAALDAMTRSSLQTELLGIWQKERKTIIFVTHNIGESIFLADRIVVMAGKPGSIAEDIRIESARPRSRTNAGFNDLFEHLQSALGLATAE